MISIPKEIISKSIWHLCSKIGITSKKAKFLAKLGTTKRANWLIKIYRGVEQLVARRAHNPKVVGSSPAPATTKVCKSLICRPLFILRPLFTVN